MKFSTIPFSELSTCDDTTTVVMTGITFTGDEFDDVAEFCHNSGLAPEGKTLLSINRITGNVMGDEGRHDWLLKFDHPEIMFNIMSRLKLGSWVKWTSDFIDNFAEDFIND